MLNWKLPYNLTETPTTRILTTVLGFNSCNKYNEQK